MRGSRGRVAIVASALALATVAAGGHAVAQARAPRRQRTPDEAFDAFSRGVEAVAAGHFADAVPLLTRSLALRPLPIVRYNLGLAYRGLNRHADAIREFDAYLREHEPDAEPERLSALRAEVTRLRELVGVIDIAAAPTDVAVRVDGEAREVESDGTVLVEPGRHRVEVSARGYRPQQDNVFVGAGERVTFRMTLGSDAAPPPPRAAAPQPRPPAGPAISPLVWIGGGVAVAGGAAMLAVQLTGDPVFARYRASGCGSPGPADAAQCTRDYDDLAGRNAALAVLASVTVVASAAAVVGVVLTLVNRPRAETRNRAALLLAPNHVGVRLVW